MYLVVNFYADSKDAVIHCQTSETPNAAPGSPAAYLNQAYAPACFLFVPFTQFSSVSLVFMCLL